MDKALVRVFLLGPGFDAFDYIGVAIDHRLPGISTRCGGEAGSRLS